MPVFIVIATKFEKLPFSVLEVCMSGDKMCRVQKADEVVDATLAVQKAVNPFMKYPICIAIINLVPLRLHEIARRWCATVYTGEALPVNLGFFFVLAILR